MKSDKNIKTLTFTAMALIIFLQGVWILNAFKLIQEQLIGQINANFETSVQKELLERLALIESDESHIQRDKTIGEIDINAEVGEITSVNLMLQEYLYQNQFTISIQKLDSIFNAEITIQKLHGKFIINRLDKETGEVLETTDPKGTGVLRGAMKSEIIPIKIDKSEGMQVLLVSPYHTIFRQMLFVLFLSFLLLLFVGYAFFFLLRSFIKERHIRHLQADFSHALTHEMATPLQTIAQVNNLLSNEKIYQEPEKRAHYIRLAQQQIINLQALTDRILTLARAEQSQLEIQPETVRLNQMIQSLTDKFSVQAKKNVHFVSQFTPEDIQLEADATLLHNAISNLIDNAIKYSGESVEIEIRCEQNEKSTFIYIKDNGYGISKKDQERIFAKFERGKAVNRNDAKGFGLGLSYVKKVMEAHHGTISLFSIEGKGSEFVLFIPVSVGETNHHKTDIE